MILAVWVVYGHTLNSPFLLDGYGNIVGNSAIEIKNFSWNSLKQAWSGPHIANHRKVAYLTFALNYLWGGYSPVGYHLVNIGIHIASALLLCLFAYQTIDTGWLKIRYGAVRHQVAWVTALLWALHPVQINAVTYLVQRMTSLAVLFALLSLTAWMAGRRSWEADSRGRACAYWMLGMAAWILGLLSKEHVAIVPLLILVQDLFLFRRGRFYRVKWRWVLMGTMLVCLMVFFYMGPDPLRRILSGYAGRNFTLTERLLTESRVLWHYISLLIFPVSDRFSLFYDYPISSGLFSPITTFLSISGWILTVVSAWCFRMRFPLFAWMTAWYIAAHLIESTVLPLEIIFEHRMYLPSIGLIFGSLLIFYDLVRHRVVRPTLQGIVISAILMILGGATYVRNMDFRDEVTFYLAELKRHPESNRNRLGLALALNGAGRFAEGGSMLRQMAESMPNDFLVQQNWHAFLVQVKKDAVLSETVYQNMTRILDEGHYNPRSDANALKSLAELCFERGDYERTLLLVDRLLETYRYAYLFLLKEICHAKRQEWPLAKQAGYEALKRAPRDIEMIYWYGKTLIHLGEESDGCDLLQKGMSEGVGDKNVRLLCQNLLDGRCQGMHPHRSNNGRIKKATEKQ